MSGLIELDSHIVLVDIYEGNPNSQRDGVIKERSISVIFSNNCGYSLILL